MNGHLDNLARAATMPSMQLFRSVVLPILLGALIAWAAMSIAYHGREPSPHGMSFIHN